MIAHALLFAAATAIRVQAIQHRGWWELRYSDGTVAANELHIPAGKSTPVEITTDAPRFTWTTSFRSSTTLQALHGAKLIVIADDDFEEWLANQKRDASAAKGRDVFLTARCTLCHTVRGIAVAEQPIGPDLTHFASRRSIGDGTIPNRIGYLGGWIVDSETIKPGNGMPINNVQSRDLQALLAFVSSLR
ncbi:MAG TPA: c-type cytochrome [Thermoanaerobaculia bacterium]|nr:c-type cytochrome [Thermoanaerobaculia bacterium]